MSFGSFGRPTRRVVGLPVVVATTLTGVALASCQPPPPVPIHVPTAGWHLAWRAETVFAEKTATPTSCRFSARVTTSGSAIRAEFTGLGVPHGYTITDASIARPISPTSLTVTPGSSVPLTFAAKPSVTVGPDQVVLSDPVAFATTVDSPVLVTVSASAGDAYAKGGLPEPGGCSASAAVPSAATAPASAFAARSGHVRWLRSLLVDSTSQRSIAALGDSITEGPAPSGPGDFPRWTDVLGEGGSNVVNAGVGGNALSRNGMFGTMSGEQRAAALLAEPNLTDLVICMGTNDLVLGASGQQILDAMSRVIAAAEHDGVRVWVCTITPRKQAGWPDRLEQERQLVNDAVRGTWLTSRGARGIDTDAAVRDPADPLALLPAFDSGDHLHPNAAGARAIGMRARAVMGLAAAPSAVPDDGPTTSPVSLLPSSNDPR